MPITFEKLFRVEYRATLGHICECGPTKAKAQEALLDLIASTPSDVEPVTEFDREGVCWVLWFEGRNWCYRIGAKAQGCCILSTNDRVQALSAMREHMANYYD